MVDKYICSECGFVIEVDGDPIGVHCPECNGEIVKIKNNSLGDNSVAIVKNSNRSNK